MVSSVGVAAFTIDDDELLDDGWLVLMLLSVACAGAIAAKIKARLSAKKSAAKRGLQLLTFVGRRITYLNNAALGIDSHIGALSGLQTDIPQDMNQGLLIHVDSNRQRNWGN